MVEEVTITRYRCECCRKVWDTKIDAELCCAAPKMLPDEHQDINSLRDFAQQHIDTIVEGGSTKDEEHYAYEVLMIAFFGKNIFQWINKHREDY